MLALRGSGYVEMIVSVCGNDRQCYKRYIVQTTYVPYVKDIYSYANKVPFMWGSLRLAPIILMLNDK